MNTGNSYIAINKAEEVFDKPIPFKVYNIADDDVTGRTEHIHDYMQIWFVQKGCCEHYINDTRNLLVKGNLFVVPPFVKHRIKVVPGEEIKIIGCEFLTDFVSNNEALADKQSAFFDFLFLEPFLVSTEAVKPRLHLTGKSQAIVEELMLEMLYEYNEEQKHYLIFIKADLLKLLAVITREYEKLTDNENGELFERYREAITAAIKYINENYTGSIYIEDACKIAMMSQSYFTYLFKQITGNTFVEYVNNLRVGKAMQLLQDSSASITDICFSVGFNNAGYFNRVFKKETGLSPLQYRKRSAE